MYDTWSPYDPSDVDSPKDRARWRKILRQRQRIIRDMLTRLRREIENPRRDMNSVGEVLRPYYEFMQVLPMTPADLLELEALCWLVLERGGSRQNEIQETLLRLVGATAAPESAPFLLEMLHYTRRGDHFGPERRQLALWGLARITMFHNVPEAYDALREGLNDRNAGVRGTAADLILDAYLNAHRSVPQDVVNKLQKMARSDPDADVRRSVQRYLQQPWAQKQHQ